MENGELRKTPLFDSLSAAGGKMVPYAGYLLPVQFGGIIEEHMAVRETAGLFDVSHMGELMLSGPDALENLNFLLTNDFCGLADGRVRYSPMCNESGGVVDDLLVYRFDENRYMLVLNAANREKDVDFIRARLFGDVTAEDRSDVTAELALQGPKSGEILARLVKDTGEIPVKYYSFAPSLPVAGIDCLVSVTGYTGEFGYELYCKAADAPSLFEAITDAGRDYGMLLSGLGARDTLRLEASMPLYGHELDETITPLEAGLSFAVKMSKPDFVGKAGLLTRGTPALTRAGLKITGRGIAREGSPVLSEGRRIGAVTSGTYLPFLKGAYAMALIEAGFAEAGRPLDVEVRGKTVAAEVTALPFYKRSK